MSRESKNVFQNRVKIRISNYLTDLERERVLKDVSDCLIGFDIQIAPMFEFTSQELLDKYICALEIQGRSAKTIKHYRYIIEKMNEKLNIQTQEIQVCDIREYLSIKKEEGLSNVTLENIRQILSAYFCWLHNEGLIYKNPMSNIGPIKIVKKVLTTYSDPDIEKLKFNAKSLRDKAIICFLYSTGCRISEMTGLNKSDVNLNTLECTVLGKGNKERSVYLDPVAGMVLSEYLDSRIDNNEALFVSNIAPYIRLESGGVRYMLKELGKKVNIDHVHPHKFRRSRATRLVKRGMPIQEVATLLGHEKLDTTMKYVIIDKDDIKNSYRKCV